MFTDTKNLAHSAANVAETTYAKSNAKSGGKLRKVWKPLLRLITLKSSSPKGQQQSAVLHPNNQHLNNSKEFSEWSTAFIEDYAAAISKEVKSPELLDEHPKPPTIVCHDSDLNTTVISSASIEKPTAPAHHDCPYGRNCQHVQFHDLPAPVGPSAEPSPYGMLPTVIEAPALEELADVPVHFIHTDDGTFFWTNAQHKIDDDLLNAWLCHSFRQFPLPAMQVY